MRVLATALILALCAGCESRSSDTQGEMLLKEQLNEFARAFTEQAKLHLQLYDSPATAAQPAFVDELRKDLAKDVQLIDAAVGTGGANQLDRRVAAQLRAIRDQLAARLAAAPPAAPSPKKK